jgi:hypothetical protein
VQQCVARRGRCLLSPAGALLALTAATRLFCSLLFRKRSMSIFTSNPDFELYASGLSLNLRTHL